MQEKKIEESKLNKLESTAESSQNPSTTAITPKEYGGRKEGLEPTRYGDWEVKGKCVDF